MQLEDITPLILTYNEAPNIERVLEKLAWAKQIIVIDSNSTDQTLDLISRYPNAQVFKRKFDTHTLQWNFGLQLIQSKWALSLDSDYVLTDQLVQEIQTLNPPTQVSGYFIHFKYCVFGKPLHGTLLPPRQALFRCAHSKYIDDGHTQLLQVTGRSLTLKHPILHDDRKLLSRWLWAQDRYMIIEAKKLSAATYQELSWGDRIRKTKLLAPLIIFFYCLIFRGGVLDGWRGLYYACQRMLAETLLAIRLIEAELANIYSPS
ncbi:glycosyltransferase family 2 protein [Acaryochloris sp. 'Moss Beach']|uniref:glycosyltransferase family 2 protein n=1 Tax=Acaryochloris sp. 'Moss Beach' TaxID=2740837 RepID=UPI001F3D0527|nr:glycosyltransferase family 2 protein [Acaryochloris sp. 'Moss Beach']UJB69817.1 glycosyltransferase family 2 protein [Acaryochloris sp. 'Moss Beach']